MRTPDRDVYVLVSDSNGHIEILGVFNDFEEAERLKSLIELAGCTNDLEIRTTDYWS